LPTPLIGIDLGGTKVEGAVLESRDKVTTLARLRLPTESAKGYAHIVHQIATVVDKLCAETGINPKYIGICTPGTLDPSTQLLKNSNTLCLNTMPFQKDLELALGLPVRMANDANCFAIAEANLGIVKERLPDAKVVFGVIWGTGVGGGVVVNGQVINGRHGIGGEWGHNFLDISGGLCYCGKLGCVEKVLAGPALEKHYESLTGSHLALKEIMSRIGSDPAAGAIKYRMIEYFAKAVAYIINILDPDAIVLGGGVGNNDWIYDELPAEVKKHIFNDKLETLFLKPKLGDSAGLFGAALL